MAFPVRGKIAADAPRRRTAATPQPALSFKNRVNVKNSSKGEMVIYDDGYKSRKQFHNKRPLNANGMPWRGFHD